MSDAHAAVSELLGAWALDACSVEEVATVEAHLADCPDCAADADRLGRGAAGLATTVAAAPPPRLRGTVMAAALARRPAVRPAVADEDVGAGYADWVERFDDLLGHLTPQQWRGRAIRDWTVQDLVAHLTASDELLAAQLASARAAIPPDPAELDGTLLARRSAAAIDEQRGRPPERTRAAWRAQADRLVHDVAARPTTLDRPVRLADPRLPRQPLRIALVQRLFETWIHTDDVRASIGAPPAPPDTDQVAQIVRFAVRVLPTALRLLGGGDRSTRLVLSGAAGGEWTLPPSPTGPARAPDATVTMDAVEFCYLLGNRRDPASVPHGVEGDLEAAATLLRAIASVGCDWRSAPRAR